MSAGGGWTGLAMPSPQRVFLSVLSFTALGREPTAQMTVVMTMSAYVGWVLAVCLALLQAPGMDYVVIMLLAALFVGVAITRPI